MPKPKSKLEGLGAWERVNGPQDRAPGAWRLRQSLRRGLTMGEVHRSQLLLGVAILAALLILFDSLGAFSPQPRPVGPRELDLSGVWRIRFADDPSFASPSLDDSGWCRIGVPDPELWITTREEATADAGCPADPYPVERMRGSTFWYRRWIEVPEGSSWSQPALFLGSARSRAQVFWDGRFVGMARAQQEPVTVELEPAWVSPGRHLLSVRVESGYERYPGIRHHYRRGVALGEFERSLPAGTTSRRLLLVVALLVVLFQAVLLALLVFLTLKTRGSRGEFFWLSLFFAASLLWAVRPFAGEVLAWYLQHLAMAAWSASLIGFGTDFYPLPVFLRTGVDRLCVLWWLALTLSCTVAFSLGEIDAGWAMATGIAAAVAPLLLYAGSALWWLIADRGRTGPVLEDGKRYTLLLLLGIYAFQLVELFSLLELPPFLDSPLLMPFLSCLVFYFAVEAYAGAQRSLAFYGRFIRPGLKRLLEERSFRFFADEKLFRGRRAVIMTIDIVGYTRTTFGMPYGVRRLFLDLWLSMIDRVVADKVFLDKSSGDGSVYCFRADIPGGSCCAAALAALEIRDHQVELFDLEYRRRLRELLEDTPELRGPAEAYFRDYEAKTGESFWQRRTQIRMALVQGYVDEGLWGLTSRSHYDVQGDLLILASRIESTAGHGEIVFDRAFLEELRRECPTLLRDLPLVPRRLQLRGVGSWEIFALSSPAELGDTLRSSPGRPRIRPGFG